MADTGNGNIGYQEQAQQAYPSAKVEKPVEKKPSPFARIGLAEEHVEEFMAELIERHFGKDVAAFNSAKNDAAAVKPKFDAMTGKPL
jgi:hypothetical protein